MHKLTIIKKKVFINFISPFKNFIYAIVDKSTVRNPPLKFIAEIIPKTIIKIVDIKTKIKNPFFIRMLSNKS